MLNKIALEEHFATEQTLGDSQEYFFADRWEESKRRLLDIEERRLRLMDAAGIELTIVSLNAPAIQAIPEPAKAVETAKRANDHLAEQVEKRRDRFRGFAALPLQNPDAATSEAQRCIQDLGFVGALVNGFTQVGDAETTVYLDDKRSTDFWSTYAELERPFYLHPRNPIPSRDLYIPRPARRNRGRDKSADRNRRESQTDHRPR